MRILFFVLSLVWASPLLASVPTPQVATELATTDGYVYVNFPKGTSFPLTVKPVAGGKEDVLDERPDTGKHAFGRWLPVGTYRIVKWGEYDWGDYPTFEVQAGRITDLGSLLPVNIGGYEVVVLPVRDPENAHDIDAATTEFAGSLQSAQPLRWTPVTPPKAIALRQETKLGLIPDLLLAYDRKINKPSTIAALKAATTVDEFLRIERSIVPPMYEEPAIDRTGSLFFGADLGQLRVRHPDGTWSNVGIDTLRSISAVEFSEDGALVAGSDNGILRRSTDGGRTWMPLKALPSDEAVIDIDRTGKTWVVTTARQLALPNGAVTTDHLTVRVAHGDTLDDLAIAREFPLVPKDLYGWAGARGQMVEDAYYINSPPQLYRLDLTSMQWATITPRSIITSHHVDPTTGVVSALHAQGAFSKIFVSQDHGASWKRIGRPPYVISDVQMDTASTGFASRWNMNAFSGTWEIYAYDPAIDDWKKTSEAPFNCKPMRVSPSLPVLCIANDASLFGQKNGQWQVEFSAQ